MARITDTRERLMQAVQELIWTGSYGSTTVDQICEKAGVQKGSFYHFFKSKADLAEASLSAEWEKHREMLDHQFSAAVPPLKRLECHCEYTRKMQEDMKARYGQVLGCPLFHLGAEVSTREQGLRRKIEEIFDSLHKYLESAIRDAHAEGSINSPDAAAKARALFAYY
ncbi:MAG TPA: TetR/AcrR family transcriptional regulator, partial [Roseimicrobium sp.]|nr:TetR/AcrR family transcriptional regulator [Roseimicrobium sp.]